MRIAVVMAGVLLVVSCAPLRKPVPNVRAMPVEEPKPAAPAGIVAHPSEPPRVTRVEVSGITFEGVSFDARDHRLLVLDQSGGPGSRFEDVAAAGRSAGGLAAVNGGFFTPEGEPLGQVIASGKRSGSWNSRTSLGSGVWHEDTSGFPAISRRERLSGSEAGAMRELLQAGPMLVWNRRAVTGLDARKASARTMVLWDGGNRWWIGRSSPASLAKTATALTAARVPGWPVRHALNLDGGRSSELWISEAVSGGPLSRRPPWNRPVRNFLVLVPRA